MGTFITSAILGIIISWCLYGKEFNQKLWQVGLTIVGVAFIATMVVSSVSTKFLETEKVFVEKSKLVPVGHHVKFKGVKTKHITEITGNDTVVKVQKDSVYDKIPYYFIGNTSGEIKMVTNYSSDGCEEKLDVGEFEIVKIDTASWFGVVKTRYKTEDNLWVTNLSLPKKDKITRLYVNKKQHKELMKHIKYCKDAQSTNQIALNDVK